MDYDAARQALDAAEWFPSGEAKRWREAGVGSLLAELFTLDEMVKRDMDKLTNDEVPAIWYALVQRLRYEADFYERSLIRHLKYDQGMYWADIAEAVDAQLGSKQAAHGKWKRLVAPDRRTTTGDMRRGGRKPTPAAGDDDGEVS